MTTYNADVFSATTPATFSLQVPTGVSVIGISISSLYQLAMFDSTGVRYYWLDETATTARAPTPAGVYITTTFTVLGRVN